MLETSWWDRASLNVSNGAGAAQQHFHCPIPNTLLCFPSTCSLCMGRMLFSWGARLHVLRKGVHDFDHGLKGDLVQDVAGAAALNSGAKR